MPARLLLALSLLPTLVACAASPSTDRAVSPMGEPRPRERKEVIRAALPSNVRIAVLEEGRPIRLATGVVVKADDTRSWVLTNAHVAAHATSEGISLQILVGPEGEEERFSASLAALGSSPEEDLAVLEVPGFTGSAASLSEDEIEVGEDVFAVGAPYGKGLSVSVGIVSQVTGRESVKTDAPIGYGASGGGIFRVSDGRLLAVVEGYRTAKVSFPMEEGSYSFDVPMPGETFGAPAGKIRAFLRAKGLAHLVEGPAVVAKE